MSEANGSEAGGPVPPKSPMLRLGPVPFAMLTKMGRFDAAIEPTVFGAPIQYSINDVAEQLDTNPQQVLNLANWVGRPPRDNFELRYTDADVEFVRQALEYQRITGLSEEELGALMRGMALSMEGLTARQVEGIVQRLATRENIGDTAARLMGAERLPKQTQLLLPLLTHVYQRHFASSIRRLTVDAIAQRGLGSDDDDYPLVRAIGFADIVNFTARTEHATPAEFRELIRTFRDTTWDVVNGGGGRIVNFIGDAVFFAADNIHDGANIALKLAAPGVLGICGPVRVGMAWAKVLSTYGDIYGAGVNLAARLADIAEPGEVAVGPKAASLLTRQPEFLVAPRPKFEARGIGIVQPYRLRYADDDRPLPPDTETARRFQEL